MNELFYYNADTDELKSIGEISNVEFLSVAEDIEKEADMRVYEMLPLFEGEVSAAPEDLLCFKLLFKDWSGLVPRQIGVRI